MIKGMRYYKSGNDYVLVLDKGEELMESLTKFAQETKTPSAWLEGLGAALEAELGYYDLENKNYIWKTAAGPLEITGLHGNIVQTDGQPRLHIHATLAGRDYQAVGGHVKRLTAGGTVEVLARPLDTRLTRRRDEPTGLDLLQSA